LSLSSPTRAFGHSSDEYLNRSSQCRIVIPVIIFSPDSAVILLRCSEALNSRIPVNLPGVTRLNIDAEIVPLMVFVPFGGLSDPIGRRVIYAFGLICLRLRYARLPSASSVTELALMRIICSLGRGGHRQD